jgi:hypothetical protein
LRDRGVHHLQLGDLLHWRRVCLAACHQCIRLLKRPAVYFRQLFHLRERNERHDVLCAKLCELQPGLLQPELVRCKLRLMRS